MTAPDTSTASGASSRSSSPWAADTPPTRSAALARLARVRPAAYARTRNRLDGAVTGLSPYLTHGLVTLREVVQGLLQQPGQATLPVQHKLVFELGWRAYFRHVWAHRGEGILASLHPGVRPDGAYASSLPDDIRQARTGVPAIDQAVSQLYSTGTLHNHARMWLASYAVHLRGVHWRAGADWMVAHLLDGDLASNHLSWQWVAGTGSHKPYLFNADNVERYAPPAWHSRDTVIDTSYEALDTLARGPARPQAVRSQHPGPGAGLVEPPLHAAPPPCLALHPLGEALAAQAQGRDVWLVHPWALREPSPDSPTPAAAPPLRVGLYPAEHHHRWPWPEARWRWVDAAMAAVTDLRGTADAPTLARLLAGARSVRSVADPHLPAGVATLAQLQPETPLFAPLPRRCDSFSQWWTRSTAGLVHAADLL